MEYPCTKLVSRHSFQPGLRDFHVAPPSFVGPGNPILPSFRYHSGKDPTYGFSQVALWRQTVQQTFAVNIYCYSDGTLVAQSDDIRGLVLETDNYPEMRDELIRVAGELLAANHGLSDDQIADATLSVVLRDAPGRRSQRALVPAGPRLVMRDATDRAAA